MMIIPSKNRAVCYSDINKDVDSKDISLEQSCEILMQILTSGQS